MVIRMEMMVLVMGIGIMVLVLVMGCDNGVVGGDGDGVGDEMMMVTMIGNSN